MFKLATFGTEAATVWPGASLLPAKHLSYDRQPNPARQNRTRVAQAAEKENEIDWASCLERVASQRCRESFLQLYDYYAPRINRYLVQQGARADVADELTQEVMLSLWRKAHLYDRQKAAVSTWLFRIARNQMIDNLRRDRGIAYEHEDLSEELSMDDEAPAEADAALLRQKIALLPEKQVVLLQKSYFEGKSHAEIAAETGQPLGSVKSRLRAALKNLRQQLNAGAEET